VTRKPAGETASVNHRPRVFIGSSSEDLPVADAVFTELESICDPTVWDQDVFAPSSFVLEGLEQAVREAEYAVLVLGANDERQSRGRRSRIPRDNLIAELGLFIGALGRNKVFVLVPHGEPLDLPSDLLGLVTLEYRQRPDGNERAAVRTACRQIKRAIERHTAAATASDARNAPNVWPLGIALVGQDDSAIGRLEAKLADYREIASVVRCATSEEAKAEIGRGNVDVIFIDIFSMGSTDGIDLIAYVRDRRREIGFSLYGTVGELHELPGVAGIWRETLQHYWKMPKDVGDEAFAVTLEDIVLLSFVYRLSGGAFGEDPGRIACAMMTREVAGSWGLWGSFR
jgi:hypothetical protein